MRVIGVMSGSSLDGLDLALCSFRNEGGQVTHAVERTAAVSYPTDLRDRLLAAMEGPALELARLHRDLGVFIGSACEAFGGSVKPDLIGSHGHTIFHAPDERLTTQIGCGAHIAARSGITTVCDLRTTDVAFGGQGAPLVPLGENLLFPFCSAFLNLGGISNLSVHRDGKVIGYDIGACNQLLNELAEEAGERYDAGGAMASSGSVDSDLLERLEALPFYALAAPRSLGREWFNSHVRPMITKSPVPLIDRLRTSTEHVARRIAAELDRNGVESVLCTGGGTHNTFLLDRIRALSGARIDVPDRTLIDFKEAIIFALLGWLRHEQRPNALASVTGAARDTIGGAVYLAN